jgi:glutamate--cysteine ligase
MLQPMVVSLWAASTIRHGQPVAERSFRARIWEDVDRARCILPDALLRRDSSLADYVAWALDVPMFFIHRDDAYIRCDGLPFRRFMVEGFAGHRPNMGDFALHLSTLFPDVRLKQHLEVRGADMGDRDHVFALSALHVGALYDEATLEALFECFADVSPAAWREAKHRVCVEGLDTLLAGEPMGRWWDRVLPLIQSGLERWEPGAGPLLDVVVRDLEARECPADRMRRAWTGDVRAFLASMRLC